jgi:hypothetical protein
VTDPSPTQDNGLQAPAYVPLADIDPAVRDILLAALRRARIAAYVAPAATVESPPRLRLYVATSERSDAQAVIAVAARSVVQDGAAASRPDLLAGVDPRAEFDALVGDWHVDTVKAVRAAERDLSQEDAEWRMRLQLPPAGADANAEDEHYVPPPPPPLPRLAGATVLALVVMVISIVVLGFGRALGLPGDLAFLAGVAGILIGAGLLVMRLRERPPEEDDDGAVI